MADNNKKHIIVCGKGGGGSGTQVQADWNETDSTSPAYIENKPTIPAAQVNSDWNANSGVAQILNKPSLAAVATSGDYTDLSNTPTIPSNTSDLNNDSGYITISDVPAQVNADWNESDSTSPAYINNKPTIPAAQVNSDWNSAGGVSKIINKPRMGVETLTFTLSDQSTVSIDVWVKPPNYFYVEDISGSNNTLSIKKDDASAPTIEVFASTDQQNWTSMGTTDTTAITATVPANSKLYLKATANQWGTGSGKNNINCSGNYNVGGNIMSLLYGDNYEGVTALDNNYTHQFSTLFNNSSNLVNAINLELPATTLANNCYYMMFRECRGLRTAPALPATTLNNFCYRNMFWNCVSLTAAPALPATTLANNCYKEMFRGCTSLTTAPALPATTLVNSCYEKMFYDCSLLNRVEIYANDISASSCLKEWLVYVAATGNFYNLGSATYPSGTSGIPTGWTEHTSL